MSKKYNVGENNPMYGLRKELNPTWRRKKKSCPICGKEFWAQQCKLKIGQGKFCSLQCLGKWNSKNKPRWKHWEKIKRKCQICGKEFFTNNSNIKSGGGKFCSMRCVGKWNSINHKGEKSCSWKGGVTSIKEKIRDSLKYQEWRMNCFIRDNFTCQNCGKKCGYLEVHHIKSFSKLLDEVKKYLPLFDLYEGAIFYTPLWDIDNGVTLCNNCHNKIKQGRDKK
jgi:hypothetical protein